MNLRTVDVVVFKLSVKYVSMRILRIQTNTQQLRVRYPWPIMVSTKGVYNIFVARATGKNLEDRRIPITETFKMFC